MRSLTANYLESHKEYFEPFCQVSYQKLIENVLTMGKEADGIGIGPLQVILHVKIEIVTIDRNYQEALSFEQMKIAGKCPLIYILYKPGHYDIIYSKDQSNADGFEESNETYQNKVKLPQNYNIEFPDKPFFVEIQKNGQECPKQEYKQFRIQFDIPYKSTTQTSQEISSFIQIQQQTQLKKCEVCQTEIEQQYLIELDCLHSICKYCLEDWVQQKTGGKIVLNNKEGGQKVSCQICGRILTNEEIKKAVGQEKYVQAEKQAFERLKK